MAKKKKFVFVLLCSLLMIPIAEQIPHVQAVPLKGAIKRQEFRNAYIQYETIIDALGISPGMTILDIGAGPGYSSFLFAEKLQSTGKVFATDIQETLVNYIAEEAKRRGLVNLFSARVTGDGLDDFYTQHRYDIVFASNVYQSLDNPIEYFGKLRNFLNPGGRLVLVLYNQAPLFAAADFTDINKLITSLSSEDKAKPFSERLSDSTRQILKDRKDWDGITEGLVNDFNRMLLDPQFYSGFHSSAGRSNTRKDNLSVLSPQRREFASWLIMELKEDGVLEQPVDQIDTRSMHTVIKLNRLFFQERLGDYLENGGMSAYIPASDVTRYTSKYEMLRELGRAGYRSAGEIETSPYFDTVIMVPIAP
ncbi:class I SAM-dependent methyltransferase [Thermodesulfobacteriota bacterium]